MIIKMKSNMNFISTEDIRKESRYSSKKQSNRKELISFTPKAKETPFISLLNSASYDSDYRVIYEKKK